MSVLCSRSRAMSVVPSSVMSVSPRSSSFRWQNRSAAVPGGGASLPSSESSCLRAVCDLRHWCSSNWMSSRPSTKLRMPSSPTGLPWRLERERERNVLFNDALNTFYLRLYGVRHMVKDHCDSEKWNPLPPHRLLLSINSKGSFICTIPLTG